MSNPTKSYWIEKLGLIQHPEGGYYKQTFRSENTVSMPAGETNTTHSAGTSIYYLLESPSTGDFSAWHRLNNLEETWHYHYGSDIIIYLIDDKNNIIEKHLGIKNNAQFQIHIPANTWFCAVVDNSNQDAYSLVGCAVSPGFDFTKFELADRDALTEKFPQHRDIIEKYTRK